MTGMLPRTSPVEAMLVATRAYPVAERRRASRGCRRTVNERPSVANAAWPHRHLESCCEEPMPFETLPLSVAPVASRIFQPRPDGNTSLLGIPAPSEARMTRVRRRPIKRFDTLHSRVGKAQERIPAWRIGPGPTAQRPAADRTASPEQSWKMLMSTLAD
jgi:hypothetical protein